MNHAAMAFWIFLGSGLGGVVRWWCSVAVDTRFGVTPVDLPLGTLVVNVLGSLLLGLAAPWVGNDLVRTGVMIGFCGGFTTFSTFSGQTVTLLQVGNWAQAALCILLSLLLCLGGCALGLWLGKALHG